MCVCVCVCVKPNGVGKSAKQLGNGYKLLCTEENTRKDGVGVIMNGQFAHKVMKVNQAL